MRGEVRLTHAFSEFLNAKPHTTFHRLTAQKSCTISVDSSAANCATNGIFYYQISLELSLGRWFTNSHYSQSIPRLWTLVRWRQSRRKRKQTKNNPTNAQAHFLLCCSKGKIKHKKKLLFMQSKYERDTINDDIHSTSRRESLSDFHTTFCLFSSPFCASFQRGVGPESARELSDTAGRLEQCQSLL